MRPTGSASASAIRADGGDGALWSLRAASLSGTRHRLSGTGPEDAFAWGVTGDRLVVAVADGVSSRPGSAVTAAAAADAAVASACTALDEGSADPSGVLVAAVTAANAAAGASGGGATTLVLGLLEGSGVTALVRVGDSSAFVLADGKWEEAWPTDADDGSIRTATRALPAERPVPEAAHVVVPAGAALVLVTDGVADALRDGPTTVAPGLAAGLGHPPDPLELARLVDFSRQGVHDDRTLLAVWPATPTTHVAEDL